MKKEIYSCLKMLESLYTRLVNAYNVGDWNASYQFRKEYERIKSILEKNLPKEQVEFVPPVEKVDFSKYYNEYRLEKAQKSHMTYIITACNITISFLKSLEMSLDKEMAKQKVELKLKEKELEMKEKENESMHKLLSKSLEAIKEFPEFQRSKFVEGTKKSHREIQRNTNPHTKSQNN